MHFPTITWPCAPPRVNELETQRVEEEEEAAFIRRGGFSGERGVRSLWGQIGANIEADKARYRFFS